MKKITKFYIDNCFHCKRIEKPFQELSEKYKDKLNFSTIKINSPQQEEKFHLTIYPAVVVYDDSGEEISRLQGVIPPKELENFIKKELVKNE